MIIPLSVILMTIAHLVRCYRWQLLIDTYEKPNTKCLISSTAIGFFINSLVPYKLGEIVRAVLAGRKMKNGIGFAAATIIAERYFDIIVVGVLFTILGFLGQGFESALFYCAVAGALLAALALAYAFRHQVKKALKEFCGLFNDSVEFRLLHFLWALIWSFKDIFLRINKIRLIGSTIIMWGLYLTSYGLFAKAISASGTGISLASVIQMLFAENNLLIGGMFYQTSFGMMTAFLLLPCALLLLVSVLMKNATEETTNDAKTYLNLAPHLNADERLKFMELYFSDDRREYIKTYLHINQGIQIIRDYSSGSNATTMLCTNGSQEFYRKYAFAADGDKLYEQVEWLQKYRGLLPLTAVEHCEKEEQYCYYDMLFTGKTESLFEYVHSEPVKKSWSLLETILLKLEESLYQVDCRKADRATVHKYIEGKVEKNLGIIQDNAQVRVLQQHETIIINGVAYPNLKFYQSMLSADHLTDVFAQDTYSAIHGDLTIENIVVQLEDNSYYIIDPNTGNVHNSPNLDYAKLLQSIHGGYEFLMRTPELTITDNKIFFVDLYSQKYRDLYHQYDEYLSSHFSNQQLRSIYFHEVVHWLRLLPYKLKKDGDRAMLFYAELLIVLNDVYQRFEHEGQASDF